MLLAAVAAIAAFAGISFIIFGLTNRSTATQSDLLEARLAQFAETGQHVTSLAEAELSLPFADRVIKPVFDGLGRVMARRMQGGQQAAIQERLNLAGRPGGLTAGGFVALQLMATMVGAGLAFDAALNRVTDKYQNALSAEFTQVLNEIRLGRPRLEALDDMGRRNKVDELNNFLQAIIQSEQLGVGIANVLRIQSEEIRRRRRQRAEEAGQKAPIKILFVLAFLLFPTMFAVILAPAIISFVQRGGLL